MKRLTVTAVIIATLTGCAPTLWTRPGTDRSQFDMDKAQCILESNYAEQPSAPGYYRSQGQANVAGVLDTLSLLARRDTHFNLCMQARGYQVQGAAGSGANAVASAIRSGQ